MNKPLADLVRPENFKEFFGQEKLTSKTSFLRQAIENDNLPSLIFWGPPGTGKTTLAGIIAEATQADFFKLSAVNSGKRDLKEVIEKSLENSQKNKKTILFLDEIHRWNKAQQDALLPYVEAGQIVLIGATTENPSFEVNSALISRARVLVLEKLTISALEKIIQQALEKFSEKTNKKVDIAKKEIKLIAELANGDARMALNTLEACLQQNKKIDFDLIKEVLQKSHLYYDKNREEHYNIISALHKSMRGGDPHGAVYWLVRMLEGGEDPVYITRRLVRFASEDVGLADNHALILANGVFEACQKIGMPECGVSLAQCVIYLSKTKKSILAYEAYKQAQQDVKKFGNLPVPLHIRNAPTKLMKNLGYGKDYKYTPKEDSSGQQYLPEKLKNRKYF
jgi:putative ATPase